jgi:iron only hydrogenase large subunit-like protein
LATNASIAAPVCLPAPKEAKYICSDLPKIKKALRDKEKLYVSVAPSYIAAFPESGGIVKFAAALKKLGFAQVEETAVGAGQVSREYEKLLAEKKMKNIITTSCPSVNLLVEKYYPELIAQLARL